MRAWRRVRNLWRRSSLEREFDEEIAFHFARRTAKNLAAGMTSADAATEARRHFGSVTRAREGMREERMAEWVPAFGRDVRIALRALLRQPALAALAVLTLSLGIGATTTVFALVDAIALRPLAYPDADRIVSVTDTFQHGPASTGPTIPEVLDLRSAATSFSALSFIDWRDFQIGGGSEPARIIGARSEASFLRVLGARPALGRLFADQDGTPGAAPVAILTNALWRTNFGADTGIIGRRIILNGLATEVVGVLPSDFSFDFFTAEPVGIYVPFPMAPVYTSRDAPFAGVRRVTAVGLLKPGVPSSRAATEVQTIGRRIAATNPEAYRQGSDRRDMGLVMHTEGLQETLFGGSRDTVTLLSIAVALLLMIAGVNMAQFLLAQAVDRSAELAVRGALGATRGRLARQITAESLVLATLAAVVGLALGAVLVAVLRGPLAPRNPALAARIVVSGNVILLTIGIAAAAAFVCSLIPLVRLTGPLSLHVFATNDVAPRTSGRHFLIAAQVAVTVSLLGVSVLLVHSLTRLEAGDRGYAVDGVTTIRLRAPGRTQGEALGEVYRQYLEQLRAVPEVGAVAMASGPLPIWPATNFSIDQAPVDATTLSVQQSGYLIVSPDYFSTLRISQIAGRSFTDSDDAMSAPVAIINQEMASRFWPKQSPIGRRLRAGEGPRSVMMTIVGVVGNVRPALRLEPMPQIYVSYLQQPEPNMTLLVRGRTPTGVSLPAIKGAVWSVVADQPLFDVQPLADVLTTMTAEPRRSLAFLLGTVAVLAVVVSGAGLFTLVTYVTARRRREIALRRVIGAGIADVIRLVTVPTLRWTSVGLVVGITGAIAGGSILRSKFEGVAPDNPALLGLVMIFYVTLAVAALCAPAVAALSADPATILRADD